MFYCMTRKGQYVFKEQDKASCFFIVDKGSVTVEIAGSKKREMGKKQSFGELALLYNAPRSASIQANEDTCFWAIDRKTFRKVLISLTKVMEEVCEKQFEQNKTFLDKVNFFHTMTQSQKEAIAGALISQKFNPGENIVNEGDMASSYYIIKEGTVECIKDGKCIRELKEGDSFGEAALYSDGQRTVTVRAKNTARMLALGRESLQKILGSEIQIVINSNASRWSLEKNEVFKNLAKVQMEKWIRAAKIVKREEGEVLVRKGDTLKMIYLMINGECTYKGQEFLKYTCFGHQFVYPDSALNKP